jgi:hypothetical protein
MGKATLPSNIKLRKNRDKMEFSIIHGKGQEGKVTFQPN